jgi:4-hydroxy-2-oxoheptanedioate aldolase
MISETETPTPFWPRPNSFLDSLRGLRPPQSFMWITLPSVEIVEMAAAHGLDCVVVDMEHASMSLGRVQQLVTVAQGAGMTALVRVESPEAEVGRVLDLGAQGVVFPTVSTAKQARHTVSGMRFPPHGSRGWSGAHSRAVRWAAVTESAGNDARLLTPEFVAASDAALATIFMIEDEQGAENIEDILDTGRPDGIIFGWGDLTVSVAFDADRVRRAQARVLEACRRRGVGVALTALDDPAPFYPGCFYSAGVDSTLVSSALKGRLAAVRGQIDHNRTS